MNETYRDSNLTEMEKSIDDLIIKERNLDSRVNKLDKRLRGLKADLRIQREFTNIVEELGDKTCPMRFALIMLLVVFSVHFVCSVIALHDHNDRIKSLEAALQGVMENE